MADKILGDDLTSKGQITVPAQHRKAWGLKPGDQIAFDPPGRQIGSDRTAAEAEHFRAARRTELPLARQASTQEDIDECDHRSDDGEIRREQGARTEVIGLDTNVLLRIFETKMTADAVVCAPRGDRRHMRRVSARRRACRVRLDAAAARSSNRAKRFTGDCRRSSDRRNSLSHAREAVRARAWTHYGSQKSDFADWLDWSFESRFLAEYHTTFDNGCRVDADLRYVDALRAARVLSRLVRPSPDEPMSLLCPRPATPSPRPPSPAPTTPRCSARPQAIGCASPTPSS